MGDQATGRRFRKLHTFAALAQVQTQWPFVGTFSAAERKPGQQRLG